MWIRNREITRQNAVLNFVVALTGNTNDLAGKYSIKILFENETLIRERDVEGKYSYVDIEIKQPQLWWPNGIGEPHVYNFITRIVRKNNIVVDEKKTLFGIRTVKLDNSHNKFTVVVNGYNIYCKGSNYVPMDMFYPRTPFEHSLKQYSHNQLIDDAVESHFNMIRIWGGGQYESQEFLDYASRKGIMLFYDFMFSDSIYPSTVDFMRNVEK